MGLRTIEQKMAVASIWNGAAPSGAINRAIAHNAADDVVAATKVWTFVNGAFTVDDVGRLLLMGGTASGNDGLYTIAAVNSPTEIETAEAPIADETAGASPWTQDVYEAAGESVPGDDMESYPEGVVGGLFDFAESNPIIVKQIVIKFGVGTTSWTLSLIDKDAVEVVVATGTALTYFANFANGQPGAGLLVLEKQTLKLVSVGAPTTAARARVGIDQYR